MSKLPIGVQLYTLRSETEKDFLGTLKKVRDIGYAGVEFAGLGGTAIEEIRSVMQGLGLNAVSAHVPIESLENDFANTVRDYGALGCSTLVVPWLAEERRRNAMGWKHTAQVLDGIGARLREEGMTLAYHNHSFEFERYDGNYGLDILLDCSNPEYVKVELDTYWVYMKEIDPAEYMGKLGNRLVLVHLKDMARDAGRSFAEIGTGIMDIDSIIKAAEDAGSVEWLIVEQDQTPRPPLESVELSFQNLRARKHA